MSLKPGQKLGSYEIVSQAGAGGMGEVYKAHDPRLNRTVAIKVLPEGMAESADIRERFTREAKAISSLNHPNICTLHDIGHDDGRDYLVMEFLEGETLAQRLIKGAIPSGEMLRIAIQIADALDSAHRQGMVHRDLKPGNVMLTRDGAKLLDFGLAKLVVADAKEESLSGMTMTSPLTMDGALIGTMQYMSPEQLEGLEADARSDIFAFGALLYEMATGQRPFNGTSQASLIASVLKEEPAPVSQIQPMVSPMLDQAISQCLAKDPDNRWQTAGDLKRALLWVADGGSMAGVPKPVSKRRRTRERVQWGVMAALVLATVALGWLFWQTTQTDVPMRQLTIPLENGALLANAGGGSVEISPDGKKVAYVARDSSGSDERLWVRPLDSMSAIALPGTENARFPFWSPDSRYLAFFKDSKLKKVLATGGPALTLCDASEGRGGSWNQDDVIIFTPNFAGPLHRVSAAGGSSMAISVLDSTRQDYTHRWPCFLPNGRDYLFFNRTQGDDGGEEDAVCVGTLGESEYRVLVHGKSNAIFAEGRLLFIREGVLMAQPFDPGKLENVGDAFPIAEGVAFMPGWSRGVFSSSLQGDLVYRRGEVQVGSQLRLFDLRGNALGAVGDVASQFTFSVSHDQTRVATGLLEQNSGNTDIWIRDVERGIRTRFTFGESSDLTAVWSPNDSLVAYTARLAGEVTLLVKPASGAAAEQKLWTLEHTAYASDWSPDGKYIACTVDAPDGRDIWIVPTDPTAEPFPFMQTPLDEWDAKFSPDGRWIAYCSDESSREEVYVAPFPGPGGKWQISTREGDRPRWSPDGRRLFYLDNTDHICVVDVDGTAKSMNVGRMEQLFPVSAFRPGNIFQLMGDGERLLVNERLSEMEESMIVVVQNWSRGLVD
jgi:Tol biopolymer transport system component